MYCFRKCAPHASRETGPSKHEFGRHPSEPKPDHNRTALGNTSTLRTPQPDEPWIDVLVRRCSLTGAPSDPLRGCPTCLRVCALWYPHLCLCSRCPSQPFVLSTVALAYLFELRAHFCEIEMVRSSPQGKGLFKMARAKAKAAAVAMDAAPPPHRSERGRPSLTAHWPTRSRRSSAPSSLFAGTFTSASAAH